ncbi:MAG: DUF2911 domain-containing protein [Cyclobacteriaceae bacterium]
MLCRVFFICLIALTIEPIYSQETLNLRVSPLAISSAKYKNCYLKIIYSQPQKKGREIFGKLVPYGQVWRTGANETTEITVTQDITVNGQLLKAGTYSLFTIPDKEKWTIIFNRDQGLWGSYNYNVKTDAIRFDIKPETIPNNLVYEPFTIRIDQVNDSAEIVLLWDQTQARFAIQFIEPKP